MRMPSSESTLIDTDMCRKGHTRLITEQRFPDAKDSQTSASSSIKNIRGHRSTWKPSPDEHAFGAFYNASEQRLSLIHLPVKRT